MEKNFLKAYNFMAIIGVLLCGAGIAIGLNNELLKNTNYLIVLLICTSLIIAVFVLSAVLVKDHNSNNRRNVTIAKGHLSTLIGASSLLCALMLNQGKAISEALVFIAIIAIFMITMLGFMLKAFDKLFEYMEDAEFNEQ